MSSYYKKKNIVEILNSRCTYGEKSHRAVLKSLLLSSSRTYNLVWNDTVSNNVTYDGNLYIRNYSSYFQGCYCKGKPHFLRTNHRKNLPRYCQSTSKGQFVKDTLVYESSATKLNDVSGLVRGDYRNCLFVLTSNSCILRYFINTDTWLLDKYIHLGPCRFSHLNYDNQMENFVVKSIRQNNLQNDSDLCYCFALFSTSPFDFIAAFEIKESIFGKIKDAFVINGLIIILSNTSYSFYSLNYILEHFLIRSYHFGDKIEWNSDIKALGSDLGTGSANNNTLSQQVGHYGYGLPLNLVVTSKPPCLFEITTKGVSGLSFGGFPWYCLGSHHEESKLYQVHSGKVVAIIDHGKYGYSFNIDDEKKAYFHPDKSGRLLCVDYDSIKCLRIGNRSKIGTGEVEIIPCYTIAYGKELKHKRVQRRSRSGRMYKPTYPSTTSIPSEIVHSLDYDGDLNVLAVLYTDITTSSQENKYVIGLYDNETGIEIRHTELDKMVSDHDEHEWNLFFDGLLLVCTLKMIGSGGATVIYMYHL